MVQKKYRGFQNEVKTNNSYKQQLSTLLKCDDEKTLNFQSLNYNKKSLLKLFQTYYQCSNARSNFVVKEKKEKLVNIKVIAGAGISSLTTRTLGDNDATFGNSNYTIFGAEFEYHFNKKRNWALVFNIAPFKFSNFGSNDVSHKLNEQTNRKTTSDFFTCYSNNNVNWNFKWRRSIGH